MPNLKHLYYYYVFAQELSTTRAAKRLGITPPTLSNQLKQLEEFFGAPLSHRADGGTLITAYGQVVLHYADRMFSAYDELKAKLASGDDAQGKHFRVGLCQNMGSRFSFDLLSLIERARISLSKTVHITFDSSDKLYTRFIQGNFDIVVGAFNPVPGVETGLISKNLQFPVQLFAPLGLTEGLTPEEITLQTSTPRRILELADRQKLSLALPMQPSVLRDETNRFLADSSARPQRTVESNCSHAMVELIERGFALGFAPTPSLLDFTSARDLRVLGPADGYWNHSISVLIQKTEDVRKSGEIDLSTLFSCGTQLD